MEELAFLNGFRNTYDTGFDKAKMSEVGSECNLKKMVSTSQFVRGLRPDTLTKTKLGLEKVLASLDETIEIVSGLELFNILQDEKQIGE